MKKLTFIMLFVMSLSSHAQFYWEVETGLNYMKSVRDFKPNEEKVSKFGMYAGGGLRYFFSKNFSLSSQLNFYNVNISNYSEPRGGYFFGSSGHTLIYQSYVIGLPIGINYTLKAFKPIEWSIGLGRGVSYAISHKFYDVEHISNFNNKRFNIMYFSNTELALKLKNDKTIYIKGNWLIHESKGDGSGIIWSGISPTNTIISVGYRKKF